MLAWRISVLTTFDMLVSQAVKDPRIGLLGASKIAGHSDPRTTLKHYASELEEVILPSSE